MDSPVPDFVPDGPVHSGPGQLDSWQRLSAGDGETGRGETREGEAGEGEAGRGDLRLMWYNVENLFYPSDDTLPGDDEFTPEGVRYWSYYRYHQELTKLARVIVAAGRWQPPGVVGLCEVEDPQVLEDLVSHPILASYHYSYLHREGPDPRGMDVACIFRPERFKPVGWQFIGPVAGEAFQQTRNASPAGGPGGVMIPSSSLPDPLYIALQGGGALQSTEGNRRPAWHA